MTPVEIIALIFVIFGVIKLVAVSTNPKGWMKLPEAFQKNAAVTAFVALILAAVVLYYLLMEITIVQVFASMLFFALIMMVMFATMPKECVDFAKKMIGDKNLMSRLWLALLIWIVLMIWVLYAIFA